MLPRACLRAPAFASGLRAYALYIGYGNKVLDALCKNQIKIYTALLSCFERPLAAYDFKGDSSVVNGSCKRKSTALLRNDVHASLLLAASCCVQFYTGIPSVDWGFV